MLGPVFIALDFPDAITANDFLLPYRDEIIKPTLKVGMQLFYAEGPNFIRKLREQKFDVFLDLKLYDIPTTVGHAVASLAKLDIQYLTVHAAGGEKMMRAAVANKGKYMKLLAVTQLTSFSETDMQAVQLTKASMSESVIHLAKLAYDAGLDGTISSPLEAKIIKENTSESFLRVTPGIRLAGDHSDDQVRIMTPKEARENGSTGIVVGRAITNAAQPNQAYQRVLADWSK